jgi:hypothetical protein
MDIKTTQCSVCGKEIKYTTKMPKKCSTCKNKKTTTPVKKSGGTKKKTYKKPPANKNTQGELVLFRALDKLMKDEMFINHGYYSNLPSPKGYPMQLDRYYPELKLAWEFDGKQHEEFNKYIHKTKANFEYYKECDELKEKYCKQQGITLIRIAYNYKISPEALKFDIKKADKKLYEKLFGK